MSTRNRRNGRRSVMLGILIGVCPWARAASDAELIVFVDEQYAFAARQYAGLLRDAEVADGFPRTVSNGVLVVTAPQNWTSGFFPGSLWLIHEQTQEAQWKAAAAEYTERLEPVKRFAGHHDIGFILYCSYGEGFRLTGRDAYREVLITGARTLCTRFDPTVGMIRSWDHPRWTYPVIIDNMMNLELLMFAFDQTGEDAFRKIAVSHADKTLKNHFRADNSSVHVVDFDPDTGKVIARKTAQGYSDDSAWARGQAWGLYGFSMMYECTKDRAYLRQAGKIADYLISHERMPGDKVPYWDFDAPGIPDAPRDASSAAIMASALLELGETVGGRKGARYREFAIAQLKTLASPAYRAEVGENGHFILLHSVTSKPREKEVDVPLPYADYYFLEALTRLKEGCEP